MRSTRYCVYLCSSNPQIPFLKYILTRLQPGSEEFLGKHKAPEKFIIQTKAIAFKAGVQTKQGIIDSNKESLSRLGVESTDIYYLHGQSNSFCGNVANFDLVGPDTETPIEDTLAGIQEVYAAGKFKRFGISNFLPDAVQKIYDIQAAAKSVLPSVFQGNYNAVARGVEEDLFPLLRKLKIAFFAYSPIAGGFLVKTSASIRNKEATGRFGPDSRIGTMYLDMYAKDSMFDALDEWETIAEEAGISKAALAYRWIAYHSALKREYGDAIIFGASKVPQVEETLTAIEAGPLDAKSAERIEAIWKKVHHEAPRDNWNSHLVTTGLPTK